MEIILKILSAICAITGIILIVTKVTPIQVAIGISILGVLLYNISNFLK